jgi:3-isopropylmalate/(R)-2-methylmalate dehydratase small subunit
MGSSRPAPLLLRRLGIAAVVAASLAPLFLRNCVNLALPALSCPDVLDAVDEGDRVAISFDTGAVENLADGRTAQGQALPAQLLEVVTQGGLLRSLERRGLVEPRKRA